MAMTDPWTAWVASALGACWIARFSESWSLYGPPKIAVTLTLCVGFNLDTLALSTIQWSSTVVPGCQSRSMSAWVQHAKL